MNMGITEKEVRRRAKKKNLQKIILSSVAVTGVIATALVAPNIFQVLEQLGLMKKGEFGRNRNLGTSLEKLLKNKLLEFKVVGDGKKYIALTEKGRRQLHIFELQDYKFKKPKKWDKKWRVIIFDIPEKNKRTRELLRITLISIGFKKLQQSVWVYPYDCEDLLMLIKADFELGRSLLYIVADQIENDTRLQDLFGLKS